MVGQAAWQRHDLQQQWWQRVSGGIRAGGRSGREEKSPIQPASSLPLPRPSSHCPTRVQCYASVVNEELHLALRAHMAPAVFLPATPRDCRRGQPAVVLHECVSGLLDGRRSRKPVGAGGRGEARMELTVEGKGNSKVQDPMYAVLVEVILSRLKRQLFFTVQKDKNSGGSPLPTTLSSFQPPSLSLLPLTRSLPNSLLLPQPTSQRWLSSHSHAAEPRKVQLKQWSCHHYGGWRGEGLVLQIELIILLGGM
ncbi:unnamed protein product [Closterium sp. NIES-65]|nr:unnamed protein product [Closterium sp. NIES-65]